MVLAMAALIAGQFSVENAFGASQVFLTFTNANSHFGALNNLPEAPQSSLVAGTDGIMLYGTTIEGGANGLGGVFGVKEDDSGFFLYHSFSTNLNDGSLSLTHLPSPLGMDGNLGGLVLGRDGWLYGTTVSGGTNNDGTIYRIAQDGTGFQVLHSFGSADGYPTAPPIQGTDGALYGTCYSTIYKMNIDGSGYTVLASTANMPIFSGLLQANDGALYGNAMQLASRSGVLFRLTTSGSSFAYLYTNTAGGYAMGTLAQAPGGYLFGTTYNGGTSNYGTIYMINTNGQGFQTVHNFNDGTVTNDGANPFSGLVYMGGLFYGTTTTGGGSLATPFGTIYRIAPDGSGYAPIYSFLTNSYPNQCCPAAAPTPGVFQGNTGALFGTYESEVGGGNGGSGGVYGLLINPPATISPATAVSGGQATITWPAWALSFTLQSTTNLLSGSWQTVTNGTPVYGLQVPATNGTLFYRLVSPSQ